MASNITVLNHVTSLFAIANGLFSNPPSQSKAIVDDVVRRLTIALNEYSAREVLNAMRQTLACTHPSMLPEYRLGYAYAVAFLGHLDKSMWQSSLVVALNFVFKAGRDFDCPPIAIVENRGLTIRFKGWVVEYDGLGRRTVHRRRESSEAEAEEILHCMECLLAAQNLEAVPSQVEERG